MHSENELGYQTRSDGFGILYGEIAGALIERCGRNGMGIVRKAVAAYGKKKGKRLRLLLRKNLCGAPAEGRKR